MIVTTNKKTIINRETVMVEIQKVPLGGTSVIDLCRLTFTDPPYSFQAAGIPPATNFPVTYKSPQVDASTFWQPGVTP